MTRPDASFVEVSSPAWSFWRALLDTCVGAIVGMVFAFVAILVIGIVGEEALSSLYWQVDLDPLFRASMGVILLVGAVLGLTVPFVMVAERYAALRAVEASARDTPDGVAQSPRGAELGWPPAAHLQKTGTVMFWCFAGLGGIWALAVFFTEDLRDDPVNWIALAVFVVLAVAAALVQGLGSRMRERDAAVTGGLEARWTHAVPRANAADAERRRAAAPAVVPPWLVTPSARSVRRVAGGLVTALIVSLGAFMLSVFMRQQCRTCDPVYWDEPIENGIDVLSLGSGAAIALCAALGLIAWTAGLVLQFSREIALARWAADGDPRRVDTGLIQPLLTGNRSMVRLQLGLSALGAAGIVFGVGAIWADWAAMDTQVVLGAAVALLALGLLVGWTDAPRSRRERQRVRDTMFPGDPDVAGILKAQ